MIDVNEPEKNDHRATQGLDPGRVDNGCQVVEVPVRGGLPVTVSLQAVAPLSEAGQAALGDLVRAAAERVEREHPHAGVVQELMLAWQPGRGWVKDGPTRDRLGAAIRSAADVVRAAGVDRESRFRWAEEAAELTEQLAQARFERAYWRDLVAANLSDLLRGMARRATDLRRHTVQPQPFTMDNKPGPCDNHNPDLCTGCNWAPAICCACNEEIENGQQAFMLSEADFPFLGDDHEDQEWRVAQWHASCDEREEADRGSATTLAARVEGLDDTLGAGS